MATAEAQRPLDDVLVAMDVVDTLRHREKTLLRELEGPGREAALLERLKQIYAAQGIEVSDAALREGVRALEERRFAYAPPPDSVSVRLAKLYVSRDRWLKPVAAGAAALVAALGIYQITVLGPARSRAEAERVELVETLPSNLQRLRDVIDAESDDPDALRLADAYLRNGAAALAQGDADRARAAIAELETLRTDLAAVFDVAVVYGPGEPRSGIIRIPDDAPLARNYYLIVKAVDPTGREVETRIQSEENGDVARVRRWGQRVDEATFNRVAADKQDDQIIQKPVIGRKQDGRLSPLFDVTTPGGAIDER